MVEQFSRQSIYTNYKDRSQSYRLISQQFELGSGCFEGYNPAKITVTAKPIDITSGKIVEKSIWSFTTEGVTGEITQPHGSQLYQVEIPGCCETKNTTRYFSLYTGKLLASSTGSLLGITFEGLFDSGSHVYLSRIVAVEDNLASLPYATTKSIATVYFES